MTQPEPGFNTANRRPPLCADSRLPLLIKLMRDREKQPTRLNRTPLFSCFPVECVSWRSAVCNRLRSHLFLFWSRLRLLVCLFSLFHPTGSQVPIMPIKTHLRNPLCVQDFCLASYMRLPPFFSPVNVKFFLRHRVAHWQTDLDMSFQTKKTRNQALGCSPIRETRFWHFLRKTWVALTHAARCRDCERVAMLVLC